MPHPVDPGGAYRPLNVRDALSYLDQVKLQFIDHPEVYNRFLDVMKEFKSQVIDTPGVIDRVSTLFREHPHLIQGFNTFLPPGYRIECYVGKGEKGVITVTTPTGTVSQIPGALEAAMRDGAAAAASRQHDVKREQSTLANGPPPFQSQTKARTSSSRPATQSSSRPAPQTGPPGNVSIPSSSAPFPPSGPSTPSAASFLASGGLTNPGQASRGGPLPPPGTPLLEFNHAISFVNKIKNRYSNKPEMYKQFLEILQTYQRETRDIADVYAQVTKLFEAAPDLLDEFKQFLPENGVGGIFGSFFNAATGLPPSQEKRRLSKDAGKEGTSKRRKAEGKKKKAVPSRDSPSGDEADLTLAVGPQTLASADEVAFFDKVKKHIDDKVSYHEFLKLINLFVQDMIDIRTLYERAEQFIGQSGEVWTTFKRMLGTDENGNMPPHPVSSLGGYGFGAMINVDNQVVENTPWLDRIKPDMSQSKVKSYGPSYRKLPKSEINLQCTGRDAMCWEVLNDEWVSHPTWAAEDAAPFMTHKKNLYEEALHKSEEERHEYDYHIEANLRTIQLLEPLLNKIQTMDPEERAHFNLKAGLGGQSKSIYHRILKKVYGKEIGLDIVKALHEAPVVALPIVLERLKLKDEEWKRAQREWNRVWREQDAKNFYKALDHQGVQFKTNDKKTLIAKSLIAEAEAKRRDQLNTRGQLLDQRVWKAKPQFTFDFKDLDVLRDTIKVVILYLDRMSTMATSDKDKVEKLLLDFIPMALMIDREEWDSGFDDAARSEGSRDGSEDTDGDVSMADDDDAASTATGGKKRKITNHDLRKKLLKQVGEKEGRAQRGSTQTPGPETDVALVHGTANGTTNGTTETVEPAASAEGTPLPESAAERAETPIPAPVDPAEVAEAVEKDKAGADASEQTWVQVDGLEADRDKEAKEITSDRSNESRLRRKANFFANNHYYVLIRLVQILYSRLLTCKEIAAELAAEQKQPINPVAVQLGLAEPDTQFFGIEAGENPARYYYEELLVMTQRLFDNEIDVNVFEDAMRLMFGNKAYVTFTIDRVAAGIVKQTQVVLNDLRSIELLELLKRDRAPGQVIYNRGQIAYRMQAETLLNGEENLYKVTFNPVSETLAVQLLGREDATVDDANTAQEKWQHYMDSFVLTFPTEGLHQRVEEPFLKRNLTDLPPAPEGSYTVSSDLAIKVALGNYRMFYIRNTEDYFHRQRSQAENDELSKREEASAIKAKERLDTWLESEVAAGGETEAAA